VTRWLAAGVAGLFLALSMLTGPVTAATADPVLSPVPPASATLGYGWAAGAVPPTAIRAAVTSGAADATGSRRSKAVTFVYDAASANSVAYGGTSPCVVNWIACTWRSSSTAYDIWIRENGHVFDWGTLRWCEATGSPDGCYQAQTAALHEFGHVDALAHHVPLADESDYLDSVMNPVSRAKPRAGWNAAAFARCDVATLQQQFDVQAWTTPYSTCLDVPTTLSLAASPLAVTRPGSVTFTAQLLSDGTGVLHVNPIAGRTVVLQQRSGTSWADLATMAASATAGSYTVSLSPLGSQDYRAVFRKPATEGVRASTSGVVSISVTCTGGGCPLVVDPAR
jgi:hypothetical protein